MTIKAKCELCEKSLEFDDDAELSKAINSDDFVVVCDGCAEHLISLGATELDDTTDAQI
jgi:uncharacterized protein YlaI